MKLIYAFLRSFFISPELLVSVFGFALFEMRPHWFAFLSERIGSQLELLKYVGLLPAGLFAFDANIGRNVLLPNADKGTILQSWPLYGELKCSVGVGVLYGFIFAVAGIATLLFDWKNPAACQSALLVTSLAGALIASATLFYANVKMEEMFRQFGSKQSP